MTLPSFGAPIARIDVDLDALDGVVIAAPAGGDILVYDGVDSWRNRTVTGDIAITAAGAVAISAGVITDADISPTAEIQVSKLLDGAARQLLQTDAAGTGVEWTDNVDVPGTLDVTGLGTFDAGIIIVVGSLDLNNQGSILNIGMAGNDFGAAQLDLVAGYTVQGAGALDVRVAAGFDIQLGDDVVLLTVKGDGTVDINATSLDLLSSATLLNVAAAGSFWTANAITLAGGSAAQDLTIQTTGAATSVSMVGIISASSTGQVRVSFQQGDGSGSANNMSYDLAYDANSGFFKMHSRDIDGSSTDADIWRVDDGQTAIDANTLWVDNGFDAYDDPLVLWRAFALPNRVTVYEQGRQLLRANTKELVQIGVLRKYKDGWIGHNDMRMESLLAGGIYQNRERIDRRTDAIWKFEVNTRLQLEDWRSEATGIFQSHELRLGEIDIRYEDHETRFSTVNERLNAVESVEAQLKRENQELHTELTRLRQLVEV